MDGPPRLFPAGQSGICNLDVVIAHRHLWPDIDTSINSLP